MMNILRGFVRSIPTLILSLALAVAVWISAVTADDPVQQRLFPRTINIEHLYQDPSLMITGEVPSQASVSVSAPVSVWDRLQNDRSSIRAWIDLSGVGPGTHTLPVTIRIQNDIRPAKVVSWNPRTVTVTLERIETVEFPVVLVRRGEPAVGYQVGAPTLNVNTVTISGPESLVNQVTEVRAVLDVTQASDNINRVLDVEVLDESESAVAGLTVTPEQVTVNQPITQRIGYRNVVVKVVSTGQPASGYRLTNISPFPPNVTVFSTNPALIDRLPGYVETAPLDLAGVKDDLEVRLPLNLPNGVEVSGDQMVLVQVGVAAIEGSITLSGLPVEVINISEDMEARISPQTLDVIVSGPLPILDQLTGESISVQLDLKDVGEGTYQFAPRVTINIPELRLESVLPSSIEVVVDQRQQQTATPTITLTRTPTPTRTATPTR